MEGQDTAAIRESSTMQKRILVPVGASEKSLRSVHHALALAKRLDAQVYILQQAVRKSAAPFGSTLEDALIDLINSARQDGLTLSHYIATRDLKEEIISVAKEEGVDLLVMEADDEMGRRLVRQIEPLVAGQIIQVRGKDGGDHGYDEPPRDGGGLDMAQVEPR
ncbi:MAG: universal stress protein [Deltaproteobacteria bacterium]